MYVMSRMRIQEDQIMYTRDSGLTSGRQHSDVLMRPGLRARTLSRCQAIVHVWRACCCSTLRRAVSVRGYATEAAATHAKNTRYIAVTSGTQPSRGCLPAANACWYRRGSRLRTTAHVSL